MINGERLILQETLWILVRIASARRFLLVSPRFFSLEKKDSLLPLILFLFGFFLQGMLFITSKL